MIYICTHKDFPCPELVGEFTIITNGTELKNSYPVPVIRARNELAPLRNSYSEGYMIYDIWKKDHTSDYIGINHYRRFFRSYPKHEYVAAPYIADMLEQYGESHYKDHLQQCLGIIDAYWPGLKLDLGYVCPCNMFYLKRDSFDKWCDFVFTVLNIFNIRNGFHTDEDILKLFCGNEYQARLHGFLMERIGTIFFHNFMPYLRMNEINTFEYVENSNS